MFRFRCGERLFWTDPETLSKSTVLDEVLLDGKEGIDRDGDVFPYILDHLRGYPVDLSSNNVDVNRLLCDARFYDLVQLQEQCLDRLQTKKAEATPIKRQKIRGPNNNVDAANTDFEQVFPEQALEALFAQFGATSTPMGETDVEQPRKTVEKSHHTPRPRMLRTTKLAPQPGKQTMRSKKQTMKSKKHAQQQPVKRDDSEEIVEMLRSFAHTPSSTEAVSISALPTPHFHGGEYVQMQPPGALLFQMQPFLNMMQRDE